MKKILMFLMLALFCIPWVTNAQQSLPYTYGFENNDLATEGWTAITTSSSSGIYNAGSSTAYEGTYLFRFQWSEQAAYLVSPLLTGTDAGVNLSFFYKESSASYGDEQFYVGYTTDETVTDPTAFTYGEIVTASLSWQEFTASLPAGTKRIAIQYVYNDAFYLYLDAFSFEAPGAVPKPTDLAVSGITTYGATLGWTENGTATSWEICLDDDESNLIPATTNPYPLTGLTPQTAYSVKVRSVVGSESSAWSTAVSFTTNEVCPDGLVCIGQGTATNSNIPTYTYYNYSLTQQIYTADEINATGSVLSVDFHSSAEKTRTLDIYMVNTTKSSFESATDWIPVTASDKVFSGSVTFAADEWTTIELNTPFAYDGISNLAIIVDDNTGSYESSTSFYAFSATNQAIRIYSDGTNYDPEAPSSYNGTLLTQKNRIRLEIGVPPTCPKPRGLAASDVTNHTANLTWTAGGEETAWTVEYATNESFAHASSMDVNVAEAALTGLAAETDYFVRVKANCGVGDESDWTNPVSFTTEIACPTPTNLTVSDVEPFSATLSWTGIADNYNVRYRAQRGFNYGFETAEAWTITDFSPCTVYDGDGLSSYGISDYSMPNANYVGSVIAFADNDQWEAHSGNAMGAFMDAIPDEDAGITANDDYFITPELTIARGDHFKFWARSVTANYGLERMKVGVYDPIQGITTYFAGSADSYVEVPVAWTEYDYDLSTYAGQTVRFAINCVSADAFALLFDDIFVGNPTDDTWDVTVNNVTSPYAMTNLNPETGYDVQVQAACGGQDGVSEWVGNSFNTPSNCAAPFSLEATDIMPHAATLSWTSYQDSYNVQYRTAESREILYFNDFNDEETEGWIRDYFIYGFTDPIYNVAGEDNYFLEMGWNSTEEEMIISSELPEYEAGAHVEFYYFGYNTANTFQVGYSTTTNDTNAFTWSDPIDAPLSTYTLYNEELADGVKYVAWKATASAQAAAIFIDDFGVFGETIPAGDWQTANGVTSPCTVNTLVGNTEYEWQVQGVNPACDGGLTEWSHIATFTTPDACQVPEIDSVNNVEATTATVYWTGIQESYNVRYVAFETESIVDFDDEEIPAAWTNDETNAWALTDTLTDGGFCLKSTIAGQASTSSSISFTATYESAGVISFDAMFMGEGTSTYYDECIFSIDGNQYFSYGAIGQAWYDMAFYFAAGEHTFTWTYSKDGSVDPTGDFFAIDNIKIQLQGDTWTTVEGVTGNTYDMTGLTPESVIAVQVQGNNTECEDGVTEWSEEYLFITPESHQVIALNTGTTWTSFNVEITLNDLKAALVAAAPGTQIQIIGQSTQATYNPNNGRWSGTLTNSTWDVAKMYMIKVSTDCEITLKGMPIDPADHPVTMVNGNNYLGFPLNQNMTLQNAFAGFAVQGDQITSQTGVSVYNRNRWQGNIPELQPGKGYIYKTATARTLVFPSSAR